jgi:hypothetical protein
MLSADFWHIPLYSPDRSHWIGDPTIWSPLHRSVNAKPYMFYMGIMLPVPLDVGLRWE